MHLYVNSEINCAGFFSELGFPNDRVGLFLFGDQLESTPELGALLHARLSTGPAPQSTLMEHFTVAAPWGKVQGEISCE